MRSVGSHSTSVREKEGKEEGIVSGLKQIFSVMYPIKCTVMLKTSFVDRFECIYFLVQFFLNYLYKVHRFIRNIILKI